MIPNTFPRCKNVSIIFQFVWHFFTWYISPRLYIRPQNHRRQKNHFFPFFYFSFLKRTLIRVWPTWPSLVTPPASTTSTPRRTATRHSTSRSWRPLRQQRQQLCRHRKFRPNPRAHFRNGCKANGKTWPSTAASWPTATRATLSPTAASVSRPSTRTTRSRTTTAWDICSIWQRTVDHPPSTVLSSIVETQMSWNFN